MKTNKESQLKFEQFAHCLVGQRYTKKEFIATIKDNFNSDISLFKEVEGKLPDQDDSYLFTIDTPELFVDVTMWFLPTKTEQFYITEIASSFE